MTLEPLDDYEKKILDKHDGTLRIVQLQAENFKKLKAVDITPNGDIVVISGPNAAGKTSVLDAIWFALAGKDALKKNPDPVRHGEKSAKVSVDLGDYTVTRTWKDGKSNLKITNNDNQKIRYGSPAGMLNEIVGKLSFDPLAFTNQSEKDQIKTLLELVPLPIDLYALDDDKKVKYDARTLINRAINHLNGKLAGFPAVSAPDEELNTSDIMVAMKAATKTISDNKDIRDTYSRKIKTQVEWAIRIADLESELLEKQDKLSGLEYEIDQLKPQAENAIDPDLNVFEEKLKKAELTNANVRSNKQRNLIKNELDAEIQHSEELTTQITDIDELKAKTIREANMPIEGLGFNDVGVTYNGTLVKQCSTAEQHWISITIGMAMNPKLRVILIHDGNALDSTNLKAIEKLAGDKGYQLWIEKVDETGKLGVYIEDGSVAEVNA